MVATDQEAGADLEERFGGGSWQVSVAPPLTCATLGFDFESLWRCRAQEFFFFFPFSGKTLRGNIIWCIHVCTPPICQTQERGTSTHVCIWSNDAVSWLLEISGSSSQFPSPPHSCFLNLQHSHILKKDSVL